MGSMKLMVAGACDLQPKMGATFVVIRNVAGQHATEMALAEHDHVV